MAREELVIIIKLSWWLRYFYIPGVVFMSHITDREIDEDKLCYWMKKGMKLR